MSDAFDTLRGNQVGQYTIQNRISRGQLFDLYAALPQKGQELVAIKFLRHVSIDPSSKDGANHSERFNREIKLLQSVQHKNIIPIIDHGYHKNKLYMVMPLIEGEDLAQVMEKQRLTPNDVLPIVEALCAALEVGHSKNIVHRDLKPENVLVGTPEKDKPEYYLVDFGFAKRPGVDTTLTASGLKLGTPEYMAPEILKDHERLDGRCDLYSLAVMIYEMLVGVLPIKGGSLYELIMAQVQQPPPKPTSLNPEFPPAVEHFVLKNLAKDPAQRHQTAPEFAGAFRHVIESLSPEERSQTYWVI